MKSVPRRWFWLFPALLPLGIFAVLNQEISWRPYTITVTPPNGNLAGAADVFMFTWSVDSKRISVPNQKETVCVDVESRRVIGNTPKNFVGVNKLESIYEGTETLDSPDGKTYVKVILEKRPYPGRDGELGRTYDAITNIDLHTKKTGKLMHDLWVSGDDPNGEAIRTVQFLDKGRLLYVLTLNSIHIWRVADGKAMVNMQKQSDKMTQIADDATTAVSWFWSAIDGSGDKNFGVWDIKTGHTLKQHKNPDEISTAQLSPDGRTLAVGGKHGTLTFWRVK